MSDLPTFNLAGPLPPGVTVLEASAGTGKTYSIAHLLVRLVAEQGVPVESVLVVTFTRLATAELRERLRERVAQAADVLRGGAVEDRLLADWAADAPAADRDLWLRRLDVAREDFDRASISTIHGFCQRMLQLNAFESGASFDLDLVPELDDLLDEIASDWLTRERYGTGDATDDAWFERARVACGLDPAGARSLAGDAARDAQVALPQGDGASLADWRAAVGALLRLAESDAGDPCAAFEAARVANHLNRRSYQTGRTTKHWASALEHLRSDPPPDAMDASWVTYFSPDKLSDKAKADVSDLLAHPFVVGLAALADLGRQVVVAERARFARGVRARLRQRLAERFEQGYGDLMGDLAHALTDPRRGPGLRAAIRERFSVGLIDEFQDTDALQWEIFRSVFTPGPDEPATHRLYLIGDPKQAIYAFRGANVHVYLRARQAADHAFTMTRNFRSDRGLIDGLNHLMDRPGLFGGGDPEQGGRIDYVRVDTPTRAPETRIRGADAPVELRFFGGALRGDGGDKPLNKGEARALLPGDVARVVVETLSSGVELWEADTASWRAVHPGDVAVLVRKHAEAAAARDALREAQVPAVISKTISVFASDAALELQRWLEALARPGHDGVARALAATDLVGMTATQLAEADSVAWSAFVGRLDAWRQTLARRGFMRAFRRSLDDLGARARLLRLPDGERRMTDLLHLAELAHAAEAESGLGLSGLLGWLHDHRQNPGDAGEAAEARLETDARAVRILTVHASKGLEFPIVLAPYLWDGALIKRMEAGKLVVPGAHDPADRHLDLRLTMSKSDDARQRVEAERREENMRLLYVALTRARHRLVAWWGDLATSRGDSHDSPMAALLHGDGDDGDGDRFSRAAARVRAGSAAVKRGDVAAAADGSGGAVSWVDVAPVEAPVRWAPPAAPAAPLAPRAFRRGGVDRLWALHSYSSLTRGAAALSADHAAPPPDQPGLDPDARDRSADPVQPDAEGPVADAAADVPLAAFPAGAEAGTCLHAFYEVFDFRLAHPDHGEAAADDAIRDCLRGVLPRHGFQPGEHLTDAVVRGLRLSLQTPLGHAAGDLRLCDLAPGDRFDELRFDLPLAGGRDWSPGAPTIEAEALADALTAAPSPGIRPEYLDLLRSLPFGQLRLAGFMTGFIDLVFRHPGTGQFFVVDYKSNRLDPNRTRRYPPGRFTPPGMQAEMEHHHYHLQYLLYTLAVHRFLRHRLGGAYALEETIGGSFYLFFRGMLGEPLGADGQAPRGVFHDRPPAVVIDALDRLFASPGAAR